MRYGAFQPPKWALLHAEMGFIACRNGLYCMPKWGILQSEEIPLKYNYLIFNTLRKPLKIRVFAPEEESVRKYALIFRGI